MRNIIWWTLWQRRFSAFWWSLGIFGLIFLNMVFYPSFKDQAGELQKSFESLPDTAAQLFGGTDFFSPVGFLNSQIFYLMLPLILGILAIGLGSSLLAREEQDKTIEASLARPISRSHFLLAKAMAGFIFLLGVSVVGLIVTLVSAKIVDLEVGSGLIISATFVCFLMCLSFGAIAFLLTALGRARGGSLGIATTYALGGYLVSSLSGTVAWLKEPSKIFAFHYYQSEQILRDSYNWAKLLFFIGLIITCGIISWLIFRKRDIA
jgi:ABC-2 type transport system permease protein